MGDLFSSFNPNTVVMFSFPGNWLRCLIPLSIIPQIYWLVGSQLIKTIQLLIRVLIKELGALFGPLIAPGVIVLFMGIFFMIIRVNFIGLFPYVFTPSSHLRFTLRLSLPLWLGRVLFRVVKQFNHNMAHLVPLGTPGALIPLIVIIETVRIIIRPGTLAVRLAANIVAGHLLLTLLGGQGPRVGGLVLICLLVSLILLLILECGVACIQAYVFTMLRSLYLVDHNSLTVSKA